MYAILRTQKLKTPVAVHRSMKHAFRAQETPNADRAKVLENTHIGAQSVAEGMAAFRAALPEKVRKNGVQCIEYLVTASPEAMHDKSRQDQDAYFAQALDWLRERHGAENVVYAGIHRDERTPHMYAYVVPKDPDTGRLNCRRWLGGAKALSEMQTDFAQRVGRAHGLQRGIEGSKAKHQRVSRFYGQLEREGQVPRIEADELKQKKWKEGLWGKIGFTSHTETPEGVADRLSDKVAAAVGPLAAKAAVVDQERRRAAEMARTARSVSQDLKRAQEALTGLTRGLSKEDMRELDIQARMLRRNREHETERQRRVDALPVLLKRAAGAVATFAEHALNAIRQAAGNWRKVDWGRVETEACRESINEHRQPPSSAMEAVLKHSPQHVEKGPEEVRRIVDQVRSTKDPEHEAQHSIATPVHRQSRGPRMR